RRSRRLPAVFGLGTALFATLKFAALFLPPKSAAMTCSLAWSAYLLLRLVSSNESCDQIEIFVASFCPIWYTTVVKNYDGIEGMLESAHPFAGTAFAVLLFFH
ncbi:MAG: hypothetical protein LBU77_01490, partial [Clostridiales bacterium]|nr:hypothetical protein [Clostridiales bacterium]